MRKDFGAVAETDPQLGGGFGDVEDELELAAAQAVVDRLEADAGTEEHPGLGGLHAEEDLERRAAAGVARGLQLLDGPLERYVLVGQGVEHVLLVARQLLARDKQHVLD